MALLMAVRVVAVASTQYLVTLTSRRSTLIIGISHHMPGPTLGYTFWLLKMAVNGVLTALGRVHAHVCCCTQG